MIDVLMPTDPPGPDRDRDPAFNGCIVILLLSLVFWFVLGVWIYVAWN